MLRKTIWYEEEIVQGSTKLWRLEYLFTKGLGNIRYMRRLQCSRGSRLQREH